MLSVLLLLSAQPVRVLFIGNSYTYFNNVPEMFRQMAPRTVQVETKMLASGGAALEDHLADKRLTQLLKEKWDFVVCQDQSTLGRPFFVDGLARPNDSSQLQSSTQQLSKLIRQAGAKPVLLAFWARRDAPARDVAFLRKAHYEAAAHAHMKIVDVCVVWQNLRSTQGSQLYDGDGSHASPLGSFVTAATLAVELLRISPDLLPQAVRGKTIGLDEVLAKEDSTLVKLTSAQLREVKGAIKRRTKALPRFVEPISYSNPNQGQRIAIADLTGSWSGITKLLPDYLPFPAKLSLEILDPSSGTLTIGFGGRPEDIVRPIRRLNVANDRFSFAIENGPNNSFISLVGILKGGTLQGVARMTSPEGRLFAVGSFELSKQH